MKRIKLSIILTLVLVATMLLPLSACSNDPIDKLNPDKMAIAKYEDFEKFLTRFQEANGSDTVEFAGETFQFELLTKASIKITQKQDDADEWTTTELELMSMHANGLMNTSEDDASVKMQLSVEIAEVADSNSLDTKITADCIMLKDFTYMKATGSNEVVEEDVTTSTNIDEKIKVSSSSGSDLTGSIVGDASSTVNIMNILSKLNDEKYDLTKLLSDVKGMFQPYLSSFAPTKEFPTCAYIRKNTIKIVAATDTTTAYLGFSFDKDGKITHLQFSIEQFSAIKNPFELIDTMTERENQMLIKISAANFEKISAPKDADEYEEKPSFNYSPSY